jgi:hypothetical protein
LEGKISLIFDIERVDKECDFHAFVPSHRSNNMIAGTPSQPVKSAKLLDQMRDLMRVRRYALRTKRAYCGCNFRGLTRQNN